MADFQGWLQKLNQMVNPLSAPKAQIAVYLSRSSAAVATLHMGSPIAVELRADPVNSLADVHSVLQTQLRDLGVAKMGKDARYNLVLAPELYALHLLEKPEVPDAELVDAVRWKLQEQMDQPMDKQCLDVFKLPAGNGRQKQQVCAVSIPREVLSTIVTQVYAAGVRLTSVDVSELALRNLTSLAFPGADQSVALLRLTGHSGLLSISRGDDLYLSRRLPGVPKELNDDAWNEYRDQLLLQVQRSLDYYESQMSQPPCNLLTVACTHSWTPRVTEYLTEVLTMPVRTVGEALVDEIGITLFNPERQHLDLQHLDESQSNALAAALPALGGTLRNVLGEKGIAA